MVVFLLVGIPLWAPFIPANPVVSFFMQKGREEGCIFNLLGIAFNFILFYVTSVGAKYNLFKSTKDVGILWGGMIVWMMILISIYQYCVK